MAKYRFRYNGPDGSHYHNDVFLNRGDEFETDKDIRQQHPDGKERFILVENDSDKRRTKRTSTADLDSDGPKAEGSEPRSQLTIQERGGGWYDVVNEATGDKINTLSLRYDDALRLTEE